MCFIFFLKNNTFLYPQKISNVAKTTMKLGKNNYKLITWLYLTMSISTQSYFLNKLNYFACLWGRKEDYAKAKS